MVSEIFRCNVPGTLDILKTKTVGVAGCGGLGSNAAIMLVRAGIGNLIIADYDCVAKDNLNRQHFFLDDVGKKKVLALQATALNINPNVNIITHDVMITPAAVPALFGKADLLIEAFDIAPNKTWLIESWARHFPDKPIICGNGIAGIDDADTLKTRAITPHLFFCGDGTSDAAIGLSAPRIILVAAMQANLAIKLLLKTSGWQPQNITDTANKVLPT